MLASSELAPNMFGASSELKFGLSSSLLAANYHELAGSRPNSITLTGSELAPNKFGASSELALNQLV